MDALLPLLCIAVVLALFALLARRIRRRSLAGGALSAALASYEEAFRATAYESHVEIQVQAGRKEPVPTPDRWGRRRGRR